MLSRLRRWLRRTPARYAELPSREAYRRWAAAYPPIAHNALMRAEQAALLALLPPLSGRVVLDLACGTGRYAQIAAERGAARVIGIDNSVEMLAAARRPGLAAGDVNAIPLAAASVDVVVCGLALGHLPGLDAALIEIGRVLRPGGAALISDVHPCRFLHGAQRTFSLGGRTYAVEHHVHLYSDYLRAVDATGLRIERVAEPGLDDPSARPPVAIVYRMLKG
jgi:malonyl-CoA O-methyltransferase